MQIEYLFALISNMERIVGGKYKLGRKIGSGSFGEIYLGSIPFSSEYDIRILNYGFFSPNSLSIFFFFAAATHIDTFEIVAVKIVSLR